MRLGYGRGEGGREGKEGQGLFRGRRREEREGVGEERTGRRKEERKEDKRKRKQKR